ncbi:DUF833-domain-containing protein [Gloeophyllum trabeum ATCC 11539]|uniref:DUF833-domain-containing protein n=1 Tax=Gloeophyllum trabeum (strain ATCC 11539 / FP-39264 / Madison 617) TaxID=670483 RepID=S7RJT7_GLOTA|nr:DUF833-domain-containing protein [Gloeophyllum trabeum ATCC 11539]EPQ54630.1 DUF833-domain-containing protein [Gloeophyllum trabeum ATCC 11539]
MCVAFWSLAHDEYALILCSNRDEFLSRPTLPAHFHSFDCVPGYVDEQYVLSGRDQRAGGAWLGINKVGKVALLTNITEPYGNYASSRGHLVSSYLTSPPTTSLHDETTRIVVQNGRYAGFNLLLLSPVMEGGRLAFEGSLVSNHGGGGEIVARPLSDGERRCGGISNGIDGSGASDWPKVKHGTMELNELLDSAPNDLTDVKLSERLFELLSWQSDNPPKAREELRNTIQIEPIPMPATGSARVAAPEFYGTRLSTVILIRRNGDVLFIERDIWGLGSDEKPWKADPGTQRVFRFQIAPDIVQYTPSTQ